ncbi:MAG: ABC transporter permease [Desertimonas sp.]
MTPSLGWPLLIALALLVTMAVAASRLGRVGIERDVVAAALRAGAQLAGVALIIGAVLGHRWASLVFAVAMFVVAVVTAGGRIDGRRHWPWIAVSIAAGVIPVLTVVFGTSSASFTGASIVAISGIIIGGTMTAMTLAGRRAFEVIRADRGQIEAALALGFERPSAITLVIRRHAREAILPAMDQTRTVGLVTLPGAYVGVLLGGGSAGEAAAAQVLVLVGLLAAQTTAVAVAHRLIASTRLLPPDLDGTLPP